MGPNPCTGGGRPREHLPANRRTGGAGASAGSGSGGPRERRGGAVSELDPTRVSRGFLAAFFGLYLVLGVILMAFTPPFQSPDAFAHFDRAVGLAYGDLTSTTSHGTPGEPFPVGVYQTEVIFSGMAAGPAARVARSEFVYGWHQTWDSPTYFTAYETGGNAPFLYLPQVLGVEIGRLVSPRVLVSYYAAELGNLLAFVALTAWAMSRFPRRLTWSLGVFLLLPMVTSLAISVNPDALLIALSAVFAAACGRLGATSRENAPPPWNLWSDPDVRIAYVSFLLMTIEKPPLLILGLLLAVVERPFRWRRAVARALTVTASAVVAYEAWATLAATGRGTPTKLAGVAPVAQLRQLLTHPGHGVAVLVATLRGDGGLFVREFIAGIGWLDTWFPGWFYLTMSVVVLVALGYAHSVSRGRLGAGVGSLAILACTALALMFTFYLVDTPYGAPTITGFQGRYLLPLYPSLIVTLGAGPRGLRPLGPVARLIDEYGATWLVVAQVLIAAQFVMTLLSRYWFR